MPFKIIRNDITKMRCDAIVNTANAKPVIGSGCDYAVYKAAGEHRLLEYRIQHIGEVPEGEVFLTPGFDLPAAYIIHAVSPFYVDGTHREEEKLRVCYKRCLLLAQKQGFRSIAFPVISTGSFGYPKEEGIRIAIDEIRSFLQAHEMLIYLVVFDEQTTQYGKAFDKDLQAYIDENYVGERQQEEYSLQTMMLPLVDEVFPGASIKLQPQEDIEFAEIHESRLDARMKHLADSFSEYLLYLIREKNMTNAEVYKRALVDKKTFSKIKNHANYHPQKITAMCLCMGAKLNLDETRDLLARAGYALSPCDKTDIIFSYFIENQIYDMIELDIQLEEYGLACLI